jgi:hypothetical protein
MNKRPWDYYLLWCAVLLSLAVNAVLVAALLTVRDRAGEGARTAALAVGALGKSSIEYNVHIERSLPVSFTVPFSATLSVPINASLPINTEFNLTLHTAFGDVPLTVPVQATVPVNMETLVPVRMSVPVSATVPVVLDVPVNLSLGQTAFGTSLEGMQTYLERVAAELQGSLLPWGRR